MQNSIFDLLVSPWTTSVVFTAIRLKVFTVLSNKMMTIEEIASNCKAVPHLLKPLLDTCVSMGLIDSKCDKYFNSHFTRIYLVEGEPQYVGNLIELQYIESNKWNKLYNIIQEGNIMIEEPDIDENNHRIFIKGMNDIGMLGEAEALKNSVDLSNYKLMIDAGGGSGIYSIFLCQQYPELKSIILDKKETLIVTEEIISGYKESKRIKLRESDITQESFGENIDVVLLSDVIYDEKTAIPVLKNAWNCLNQNGILIIRGYYSDPEESKPLFGALFVLGQIVFDPNRKIMTISSVEKIVKEFGFTIMKRSPLTRRSFLIVAKK